MADGSVGCWAVWQFVAIADARSSVALAADAVSHSPKNNLLRTADDEQTIANLQLTRTLLASEHSQQFVTAAQFVGRNHEGQSQGQNPHEPDKRETTCASKARLLQARRQKSTTSLRLERILVCQGRHGGDRWRTGRTLQGARWTSPRSPALR